MQQIGILSDTHGYVHPNIAQHFAHCHQIWHAGDIGPIAVADQLATIAPLKAVYGNIDDHIVRATYPEHLFFTCEDTRILMTYIAGRPNRYPAKIKQLIAKHQPDIFICGHSHLLLIEQPQGMHHLHLNPGAAGKHGFHQVLTLVRLCIDGKRIFNCQIIELGQRRFLEPADD